MKKTIAVISVAVISLALLALGCGQKKAGSSQEAINTAQAMQTVQQKIDYLIGQAETFYNSKAYPDAVAACQYVLSNLDKESQKALQVLNKAKQEMASSAQKALGDLKNTFKQ